MTTRDREAIVDAARRHAVESARAQGLPDVVRDPGALRAVAALVGPAAAPAERRAA